MPGKSELLAKIANSANHTGTVHHAILFKETATSIERQDAFSHNFS